MLETTAPHALSRVGLDVLPELAKACDQIKSQLQSEIDEVIAENTKVLSTWSHKASTKVGAHIENLDSSTKPENDRKHCNIH